MKVIDPGHVYAVETLDGSGMLSKVQFVKRCQPPDKYPGNLDSYPGTTIQELLRVLIDRTKYLDQQIPHIASQDNLNHYRAALLNLEDRAAEQHGRTLPIKVLAMAEIETLPTCPKCLHILPETHKECQ